MEALAAVVGTVRRGIAATARRLGWWLDAILPAPPGDEMAADEAEAASRRRRFLMRLREKAGKGGYR